MSGVWKQRIMGHFDNIGVIVYRTEKIRILKYDGGGFLVKQRDNHLPAKGDYLGGRVEKQSVQPGGEVNAQQIHHVLYESDRQLEEGQITGIHDHHPRLYLARQQHALLDEVKHIIGSHHDVFFLLVLFEVVIHFLKVYDNDRTVVE